MTSYKLAQSSDAKRIYDLMEQVHSQMERPELFVCDDLSFVERHIHAEGFTVIALGEEEQLIGCLIVRIPGDSEDNLGRDLEFSEEQLQKAAHMEAAVVSSRARGRGVMRNMLIIAENHLKALGFCYLLGTVSPENPASYRNLEKLGYRNMLTKEKYGGKLRRIYLKEIEE